MFSALRFLDCHEHFATKTTNGSCLQSKNSTALKKYEGLRWWECVALGIGKIGYSMSTNRTNEEVKLK